MGDTLLLMHFDDTITKDDCGNTITVYGEATKTNDSKFGPGAISLSGTEAGLIVEYAPIFDIGTGDFTIDFWWKVPSGMAGIPSSYGYGCIVGGDITGQANIGIQTTGRLVVWNTGDRDIYLGTIGYYEDNNYHHYAITRKDGTIRWFIDGQLKGQTDNTFPVSFSSSAFYLFNSTMETKWKYTLNGYIDEFRISNVARWTENFTPETSPYSLPKFLIKQGNNVFGYDGGVFSLVNSSWDSISDSNKLTVFSDYGDTTLHDVNMSLLGNTSFSIICYSVDNDIDKFNLTGVPAPQIILPTSLISLKSYDYVDSVSITYTVSGNGVIKVAMTKDLSSYYVYSSGEFVEIDIDDISTDGNTLAEINSIPESDLHDFTSDVDGIAFAYYISVSNTTDVAKLSEISIQADGKGAWKSAQPYTDFTYEYANNDLLRVNLITSGDYKINYPD